MSDNDPAHGESMGAVPQDDRMRAIHEAGHVVAAYLLDAEVAEAHIVASDERQAGVEYVPLDTDQPPTPHLCEAAYRRVVVYLAGMEAQCALMEDRPARVADMPDDYWDHSEVGFNDARDHFAADDYNGAWAKWIGFIHFRCQTTRTLCGQTGGQVGSRELFRSARKEAFTLFTTERNRALVSALANELVSKKRLDREQIRAILASAPLEAP